MVRCLVTLILLASGCSGRMISSVENGYGPAASRTVILSTLETKNFVVYGEAKHVWWECAEKGGGLVCRRTCDIRDDEGDVLACQKFTTF